MMKSQTTMQLKYIILLLAAAAMATSCDDNDYTPGQPTPKASVSPYFPADAPNYCAFSPDDKMVAEIPVRRLKADQAQTLAIVSSGNEDGCFSVPASVDFDAGQKEAILSIDCSKLPPKEERKLHLTFDADQLDPYVDGLPALDLTAIVSVWTLYGKDVEVMFDNKPAEASEIYMLEGSRQFKITNFVSSTIDLPFTVANEPCYPWGDGTKGYAITPTKNSWENTSVANYWYFYDQDNDFWPVWTFDGITEPSISYLQIFSPAEDDGYYYTYFCPYYESSITPGKYYGYMCLSAYVDYADGTTGYPWIEINFEPLFDPNL